MSISIAHIPNYINQGYSTSFDLYLIGTAIISVMELLTVFCKYGINPLKLLNKSN